MIRKALSILGILALSGFLINGISMTQNIKKLHAGLEDNLESIQRLNEVQAAIIDKNEELESMLATVGKINGNLDQTAAKTGKTLELLAQVVDLNTDTLRLNDKMLNNSVTTKQNIGEIHDSLAALSPYMDELDAMLKDLDQTARKDAGHLNAILRSTESLNRKTPGVSP